MLKSIPTNDNSKGLCAHSTAEKPVFSIIILPDPEQGCIKLLQYTRDQFFEFVILAHFEVDIGAMATNHNGTLIASTSTRGHIIKIHSTDGGQVI